MIPAHQRLGAQHLPCFQIDLGLVVDKELIRVQTLANLDFHLVVAHQQAVHGGVEGGHRRASGAAGTGGREAGKAHQVFCGIGVGRVIGHPRGNLRPDLGAKNAHRFQRVDRHLNSQPVSPIGFGGGHGHQKAACAEPAQQCVAVHRRTQRIGDVGDQGLNPARAPYSKFAAKIKNVDPEQSDLLAGGPFAQKRIQAGLKRLMVQQPGLGVETLSVPLLVLAHFVVQIPFQRGRREALRRQNSGAARRFRSEWIPRLRASAKQA